MKLHPQYSFSPLAVIGSCGKCDNHCMFKSLDKGDVSYECFDSKTDEYSDRCMISAPEFEPIVDEDKQIGVLCLKTVNQRTGRFGLVQKRLVQMPAKDTRVRLKDYERQLDDMEAARAEDDDYVRDLDLGLPDIATSIDGQYQETVSLAKARLLLWNLENGLDGESLKLDVKRVTKHDRPGGIGTVEMTSTKREDLIKDCQKLLRMCDDDTRDLFWYTVTYLFKYASLGREYAIGGGSPTLQSLTGTDRKTVCEGLCWHLDTCIWTTATRLHCWRDAASKSSKEEQNYINTPDPRAGPTGAFFAERGGQSLRQRIHLPESYTIR